MANKSIAREQRRSAAILAALVVLLAVVFVVSFNLGQYPISPAELLRVLFGKATGAPPTWSSQVETVVFRIRLPRLVAAILVGGGLSAAGAAYQGLFRNPMVSPDLLGASSGAGFGAALGIYLALGSVLVSLSAFVFGLAAVGVAYLISTRAKLKPILGLVLTGIMVSSLLTSATSFIKLIADPEDILPAITYWLMGSLASIRMADVVFAGPVILVGLVVLHLLRWRINLSTLGEEEAKTLGVNTSVLRLFVILAATLITAACVSISGVIGWVGLVIPHLGRLLVGYDYRRLLPASVLMGASFLMVVDDVARTLATSEIPLGILTAFIGAPFFLYLILKKGRGI